MSLRAFHLVFIALSALFAVGFGLWLADHFLREGDLRWIAGSLASLACAALMVVYGVRFFRKTRGMVNPG